MSKCACSHSTCVNMPPSHRVQVDFWGFGVIVFECISGKRPFLHGHPSAGFAWYTISIQCIHIEIHACYFSKPGGNFILFCVVFVRGFGGTWVCGESWLAIKDSLTHRPNSQGWAPECPLGLILYVYFVLLPRMVSGLGLPFFFPYMS